MIGGGSDERYICSIYQIDGSDFILIDPEGSDELVDVLCGQTTTQMKKACLGLGPILRAVKTSQKRVIVMLL